MAANSPIFRVRTSHTGTEYESGAAHRSQGVNEPMPGVEAEDARLGEDEWSGGHNNHRDIGGRQKRLRPTLPSKKIIFPGKGEITVYHSGKATEDDRWVHILEVNDNGTRKYLCVACRKEYTGHETKIISHKRGRDLCDIWYVPASNLTVSNC